MPVVQPLPTEIQEMLDRELARVAQCDGELLSLQSARDNWLAQRKAAQDRVKALKVKYSQPNLGVWPPEEAVP